MLRKIILIILRSNFVKKIISFLEKIRLKKSDVSAHDILIIFVNKITEDEIIQRANAVTFNFILAIFPAIIFLFTLLPYITIPEFLIEWFNFEELRNFESREQVMYFLKEIMPEQVYESAKSTIVDIVSQPRGGLLSFGFIFAMYMATNGMMSLMKAFNRCYKTVEKRGILRTRGVATLLTVLLVIVFIISIILLVIGQHLLGYFAENGLLQDKYLYYLVIILRFIVVFLIFLVTISLIYYLAPSIKERWKFISPGSFMAAILSLSISFAFSYYINSFGVYNRIYGSIGALIALMVWLSILTLILLAGFELNASIDKLKQYKK